MVTGTTGATLSLTSYSGLILNREVTLTWNITTPSGYTGRTARVTQFSKIGGANEFTRIDLVSAETNRMNLSQTINYVARGDCTFFEIDAAIYNSANQVAEVLTLTTPLYYCSGNSDYPTPPHSIICTPEPALGGTVTISCEVLENIDYLTLFLQRRYDSGSWEIIYSGKNLSYTDTISGSHDTVQYRIYTRYANGRRSFEVPTDVYDLSQIDIYVGVGGVPVRASEVYIGSGGSAVKIKDLIL